MVNKQLQFKYCPVPHEIKATGYEAQLVSRI